MKGRTHVLFALILLSFLSISIHGKSLGLDKAEPTNRAKFHAIPVALSEFYYGRKHDYTADWSIAMFFQGGGLPTETTIAKTLETHAQPSDRPYFWTADDRGFSDYVYLAFALFGPHVKSLFKFYFVVLGAAVVLFVIRYRRDWQALGLLALLLTAIDVSLPIFVRAPGGLNFGEASLNISESRMFDILAAVTMLHLVLASLRPREELMWRNLALTLGQVLIFTFLFHARSSIGYLIVALVAIAGFAAMRRLRKERRDIRTAAAMFVPACLVIFGLLCLSLYERAVYNPQYFTVRGSRTVWHNVLMGLSFSPTLAHDLNIGGEDKDAVQAVIRFMREHHDPRLDPTWNETTILNSFGGHNTFDWDTYESVARELVMTEIAAHPLAFAKLVLWEKPRQVYFAIICDGMMLRSVCPKETFRGKLHRPDAFLEPLSALPLVIIFILTLISASRSEDDPAAREENRRRTGYSLSLKQELLPSLPSPSKEEDRSPVEGRSMVGVNRASAIPWFRPYVAIAAIFASFGLAPSILVYPGLTQLGGTIIFGLLALYLLIWAGATYLIRACCVVSSAG